ncbi:MAG TPA: DUF4912 domain-containing protein [Capillibacterium sp.]
MGMTLEELAKKTKEELLALARELKIRNRSKMTKKQLIESLNLVQQQSEAKAEPENETFRKTGEKAETAAGQLPQPIYTTGLSTQESHGSAQFEEARFPLPASYNETKITLLIRDPYWLYAYWDLNRDTKAQMKQDYGDWEKAPLLLRLWEEEASGHGEAAFFDTSVHTSTNNWYLNVCPHRRYTAELGYLSPAGEFICLARSNTVTTPRATPSEVLDEEWMIIEEDFRRLYRLAGDPQAGSAELAESLLKRLEQEMGSGAVTSLSSPFGQPPEKRHFWLVLNTELIVYGATEPTASLTLDGQPVCLRPDGSFTVRLALPDGVRRIPVTARSQDRRDEITITPVVTKETY